MNMVTKNQISLKELCAHSIKLLGEIITIPSYSGEEKAVADHLEAFLNLRGLSTIRKYNNLWCYNRFFDPDKPLILLNSHHDTVRPNDQYKNDPFQPVLKDGKLYGLGSNDAGGPLVSLVATFLYFYEDHDLPFNLCLALTAEEETSGTYGIKCILQDLMPVSFAIVGEPTGMQMAVAERGSMVLDCVCTGRAGHAAREEGDNAIYKALKDINWFAGYHFPVDPGQPESVKLTVTGVHAGIQHNIVPGECSFVVDVRFDHNYTQKEILTVIDNHTFCEITVRPNVLYPSDIAVTHPLVKAGLQSGRKTYMSPTSSDMGWLQIPAVKMGPGESSRSHTADEYILLQEIESGISIYIQVLSSLSPYLESQ